MKSLQAKLLAAAALLALGAPALAESTYGYSATGAGTVTATARINISVAVPKLILLRVGSANTTIDTLNWSVTHAIPTSTTPVTPAGAGPTAVDWDGTAPTIGLSTAPTTTASAWTNAGTASVNCAATAVTPAGGPTLANFSAAHSTTGNPLPHPTGTMAACVSAAFTSNSLRSSTWTYTLGGTPSSWAAGTYSSQITYTASGV